MVKDCLNEGLPQFKHSSCSSVIVVQETCYLVLYTHEVSFGVKKTPKRWNLSWYSEEIFKLLARETFISHDIINVGKFAYCVFRQDHILVWEPRKAFWLDLIESLLSERRRMTNIA